MKTIKQLAEEIGVSKQAIFYRINKLPLSNELKSLMSKENGILTVSFDGEKLIKQTFLKNVINDTVKEPSNFGVKEEDLFDGSFDGEKGEKIDNRVNCENDTIKEPSNKNISFDGSFNGEIIEILKQNIDVLQKELTEKNRQLQEKNKHIENLSETIRIQAESINTDRKTELAEALISGQQLAADKEHSEEEKKKGIFSFFRRK